MRVILGAIGLFIIGWVLIVVMAYINQQYFAKSGALKGSHEEALYKLSKAEMLKDGSKLLTTGVIYTIGTILCYFINVAFLQWAIIILLSIFIIYPLISLARMINQAIKVGERYTIHRAISGFICTILPIIMVINIIIFLYENSY